ncbi:MAG: hypothetical protein ACTSRG_15435 [Candidatus Helarchaeota archaeon]
MIIFNLKNVQFPWYTILMKILAAIPSLIDFQFESMKIGPKCGARFFDLYSED